MTGYRLGVDLGTTFTSAAVYSMGRPTMVGLGNRAMQIPSVLFLKPDGQFLVGEAAERRGGTEPSRVTREFKRRLGDRVPILVAGTPYSAEALQAVLLSWVVDQVAQREGSAPEHITVTCPANWGPFKRELFDDTIRLADIGHARVITEPEAVAVLYAARKGLDIGQSVAVYDLGGGTFDAAVLTKTDSGFRLLGAPEGIEQLGGIDFDEALFRSAVETLGGGVSALLADPSARDHDSGLARLRRDCVDAKEALSGDHETAVPVVLPGLTTTLTLTREGLETMIGPTIADTVSAMRRALRSAGLQPADLTAIVLSGGSSRIPLVSRLLTEAFDRPLALDSHPKHDVALGAALPSEPAPQVSVTAVRTPRRPTARPVGPPHDAGSVEGPHRRHRPGRTPVLVGVGGLLVAGAVLLVVLVISGGSTPPPVVRSPLPKTTMLVMGGVNGVNTLYAVDIATKRSDVVPLPDLLTANPHRPNISPDRTAFVYIVGETSMGVPHLATFDGADHLLFDATGTCTVSGRPAFSADGSELAVVCPDKTTGKVGLYVVDRDGTFHPDLVPDGPAPVGDPTWTGDGRIVFMRDIPAGGRTALWTVDPGDPSGTLTRLTHSIGSDMEPDWSPAHGVVFRRLTGNLSSIWVYGPGGGHRLTTQGYFDAPSWSPTGQRLAYVTKHDQAFVVETMSWRGTGAAPAPWPAASGLPGPPAWGSR